MSPEIVEETLRFASEGLSLEGILAYPESSEPETALLLLAPHPHMGGRMDNNVIRHLARRGAEEGFATLRFDYRGVGASEIRLPPGASTYDHFAAMEGEGRHEELLADAEAAWSALRGIVGDLPKRVVVGYSLGAILAGVLGTRVDTTHLVGISPPVPRVPLGAWQACPQPKLFLGGDADFAFEVSGFEEQYARLPEPKRFDRLAGADHFHRKGEERLHRAVARWLRGEAREADPRRVGPREGPAKRDRS